MKRWALLVAILYCLILAALTIPAIALAFAGKTSIHESLQTYVQPAYWIWLALMVAGQAALLAMPVRVASRRPQSRSSLVPTVLAGGIMLAGLVAGACYSLFEFFLADKESMSVMSWTAGGLALATWVIWGVVFFRMGRTAAPEDLVSRMCRCLFKGSILELLIAVPTHIIARYRDYCCAGIMTFMGLTMGVSVMLFAFGPAVFFLFVARWQRLHPKTPVRAQA